MLGILMDGGWMMLPLVLCSVIAVAIIIDRARAFRAAGSDHEALRKQIVADLDAGNVEAAAEVCAASQGPVAATVLAGLRRYTSMKAKDKRPEEIEAVVSKTMEEYAPKAMHGLQKRLNGLVLIASISPLLGMTGTVTGMIRSFDVMAASAGLDPGAVAGGIGEALITTAAGLLIAIPAVIAHSAFSKRIEDYTVTIETCVTDILEFINGD